MTLIREVENLGITPPFSQILYIARSLCIRLYDIAGNNVTDTLHHAPFHNNYRQCQDCVGYSGQH